MKDTWDFLQLLCKSEIIKVEEIISGKHVPSKIHKSLSSRTAISFPPTTIFLQASRLTAIPTGGNEE